MKINRSVGKFLQKGRGETIGAGIEILQLKTRTEGGKVRNHHTSLTRTCVLHTDPFATTSNPTSISQYAALEALTNKEDFIIKNNNLFKERRDIIVSYMNNIKGIECNVPNGAFYIFPSCIGLLGKKDEAGNIIKNSNDFCSFLLEQAGVATVPGLAFGLEGYFRISYATSTKLLKESGKRIQKACETLK